MKRKLALLFALATLIFALCACAGREEEAVIDSGAKIPDSEETAQDNNQKYLPDESAQPDEQPDEQPDAQSEESPEKEQEPEIEIDTETQLQLIIESADTWLKADEGMCQYVVTDLDGNGRLEIISSVAAGTGLYTYSDYYEISPDGSELTKCRYDISDEDSQPDIMTSQVRRITDETSGKSYYIFEDVLRNGYAETYITKCALWLEKGEVHTTALASYSIIAGEDGEVYSYHDAEGGEITQEQYDAAQDAIEGERSTAHLYWVSIPSQEEIFEMVRQSYNGFITTEE